MASETDEERASSVEYRFDAEHTVGLLASALRALHSVDTERAVDLASVLAPADIVSIARNRLDSQAIDDAELSSPYRHLGVDRLVQVLDEGAASTAARVTGPVLTHGAPTLDRLVCRSGAMVGFVDWRGAALADPYRDLAIAARDVVSTFGPVVVPVLFDAYGLESPDPLRLDWYALAAELTG